MQVQANIQAVLEAVKAEDFLLGDEHRTNGSKVQLAAIAVYERDGNQCAVALFDKTFSDYYCINEVVIRADGKPYVTRNNCAGTVFNATMDPVRDIAHMEASVDQELIKKCPALAPGKVFNILKRDRVMA